MPMSSADKQGGRVVSRVNHIIDRSRSNRVLTRLRVLLRSNEFYLIPLSLVVGVIAGAVVTLMSEIAQIMHVTIFGIPIDVRLSANAYVNPVTALVAPALRRARARRDGMAAPALENRQCGRPDRGQRVARRTPVVARQRRGERPDPAFERLPARRSVWKRVTPRSVRAQPRCSDSFSICGATICA